MIRFSFLASFLHFFFSSVFLLLMSFMKSFLWVGSGRIGLTCHTAECWGKGSTRKRLLIDGGGKRRKRKDQVRERVILLSQAYIYRYILYDYS